MSLDVGSVLRVYFLPIVLSEWFCCLRDKFFPHVHNLFFWILPRVWLMFGSRLQDVRIFFFRYFGVVFNFYFRWNGRYGWNNRYDFFPSFTLGSIEIFKTPHFLNHFFPLSFSQFSYFFFSRKRSRARSWICLLSFFSSTFKYHGNSGRFGNSDYHLHVQCHV